MRNLRPIDLAREHGISTQAVRNYEKDGFIPPAHRTGSGYRLYTETHASALRAFLALVPAHGHALSGEIMQAVNAGRIDATLTLIDRSHVRLLKQRETLDEVGAAVRDLATGGDVIRPRPASTASLGIGPLSKRLGVTAATLRNWERQGLLAPRRDSKSHQRVYGPEDLRNAELTHLLRRGGYRLERIRHIINQIDLAGGTPAIHAALGDWRRGLTARGIAMLDASAKLSQYMHLLEVVHPAAPAPGQLLDRLAEE